MDLPQPKERLLAGFPDISSYLPYEAYVLGVGKSGVPSKLYINFGEGGAQYKSGHNEDLAQNVFLKVHKSLDRFRNKSSVYTWIPHS